MSLFTKINIALLMVVGLFMLEPFLKRTPNIEALLKKHCIQYTLDNNKLILHVKNDADIYECLYEIYPYVNTFVIKKEKQEAVSEITLQKK